MICGNKIGNVLVNLILSVVFLYIPMLIEANRMVFCVLFMWITSKLVYILGNIIASLLTLWLSPDLCLLELEDTDLWKRMMRYGMPIMVAGIAFAINEQFDKILCQNYG
jgi:O-antigen/teichoic acid export membrane protein